MAHPADLASLEVVLTTACNLDCAYCYQNTKGARRMNWGTLQASIDLLLRSKRPEITLSFYGGEPLIEFALLRRAVAYAERERRPGTKLSYGISTNGVLLDDDAATLLASRRFDTQLSFDGVPAAQDLRGRGTFRRLDSMLDRLRSRHPAFFRENLRVGSTVTAATLPHLADSIEYFLDKGVARVNVAPRFTHDPEWRNDLIAELDRQFARIFRVCVRHHRRTGQVPFLPFRWMDHCAPRERRIGLPLCGAATGESLVVDVDGQLRGCEVLVESYQRLPSAFLRDRLRPMRPGDVREPGLGDRLAAYREAARASGLFHEETGRYSSYGRCRDCRHWRDCFVCPVSVGHIRGNTDPLRVPDFHCAFNRVALDYRCRFPREPTCVDRLQGRVPLPAMMRELETFAANPPVTNPAACAGSRSGSAARTAPSTSEG